MDDTLPFLASQVIPGRRPWRFRRRVSDGDRHRSLRWLELDVQGPALGENHRAFHDILKFADITRPIVVDQKVGDGRRQARGATIQSLGTPGDEMPRQRRNVLATLPERGIWIGNTLRR